MLIVGLQCGHDAAVTVLVDGEIRVHLELERKIRTRHAGPMMAELIDDALSMCGVAAAEIDLFALCTTQGSSYGSTDGARLRFDYDWRTAERLGEHRFSEALYKRACVLEAQPKRGPGNTDSGPTRLLNTEWPPNLPELWADPAGMGAIDTADPDDLSALFDAGDPTRSYVLPMRVTFDGQAFAAVGVLHQLAHAAAAFYQSPFEAAPIIAHDNGAPFEHLGYRGGMIFYGEGNRLIPLWRARIAAGLLYSRTAWRLGLGRMPGPGKLMGLSAYGPAEFYDGRFIGDAVALSDVYDPPGLAGYEDRMWDGLRGWFAAVDTAAAAAGFGDADDPFSPLGHRMAATAQKTFEELVLYTVERTRLLLDRTGRSTGPLCLSGGCALNCPTNSRIVEETVFDKVFVPPSCDDGGLSTGAALLVQHHVLGQPRRETSSLDRNVAYLGREASEGEVSAALSARSGALEVEEGVDTASRVAEDLADDRVVAVFDGRAESGPRALGHRSLLADPRRRETWDRVNRIKRREWWRPFAPACLAERLRDHFDGGPEHSPHMLFNYRVRSDSLGAVTHVDGTARTQTVGRDGGTFRAIIEAFEDRTGLPVVLNTSFNGPGEPIVDTADDALRFIETSEADALYIKNRRISRRRDR